MNHRGRFFEELQRAIGRGFTLAAVSASLSCTKPSVSQVDAGAQLDSGSSAATVKTLRVPRVRDPDGGLLSQVPSGALACTGEANEPFHGQCCTHVHCYAPTGTACVVPTEIRQHAADFYPRLAPGSGLCMCGQTQGPFAQPDGGDECCYVVGTMGCAGRPLREGGEALVAAVVGRSDWA